jgi:glutathione synthase
VAGADDFIANLWDVHLRVTKEGYVQVSKILADLPLQQLTPYSQNLSLGLFRSDYMVHHDSEGLQIKQVEFNTIASSFGGLSSQTSLLHK